MKISSNSRQWQWHKYHKSILKYKFQHCWYKKHISRAKALRFFGRLTSWVYISSLFVWVQADMSFNQRFIQINSDLLIVMGGEPIKLKILCIRTSLIIWLELNSRYIICIFGEHEKMLPSEIENEQLLILCIIFHIISSI